MCDDDYNGEDVGSELADRDFNDSDEEEELRYEKLFDI